MEEALEATTPFYTIDPMVSTRLQPVQDALLNNQWSTMISNDDDLRIRLITQGVENPESRDSITWDDANLFFLSCIDLTRDGKPNHLEAGISKARFGRFPYKDGSPLTYLMEWIRISRDNFEQMERLESLLEKLTGCLEGTSIETGTGRIKMQGWLDDEETTELRKCLTSRCWRASADEPFDGGCIDSAKHLVALLRAAEKRSTGVVLRVHK